MNKFNDIITYIRSVKCQYEATAEETLLTNDVSHALAARQLSVWDKLEQMVVDAAAEETGRWRHAKGTREYFCPRCDCLEHSRRNYCSRCGLHMVEEGAEPTYV